MKAPGGLCDCREFSQLEVFSGISSGASTGASTGALTGASSWGITPLSGTFCPYDGGRYLIVTYF